MRKLNLNSCHLKWSYIFQLNEGWGDSESPDANKRIFGKLKTHCPSSLEAHVWVREKRPTLQSSQHWPWAQTASPFRVHVVALQHGFIHSWDKLKETKSLPCEISRLDPVRWRPSGQGGTLPVRDLLFYLTWPDDLCESLTCSGFRNAHDLRT